jgi:hypothetical protein
MGKSRLLGLAAVSLVRVQRSTVVAAQEPRLADVWQSFLREAKRPHGQGQSPTRVKNEG